MPLGRRHDIAAQSDRDDLVFGLRLGAHGEFLDAGRLTHGRAELALLEPVGSRLPPTTPGSGGSRDQPLSFSTWALKSSVVVSGEGAWSVNVVDWATTVVPFTLPMIW